MTTGTGGVRNLQVLLTANTGNLEQGLLRASNQVEGFARHTNKSSESMLNFGNIAKVAAVGGAAAVAVGLAYAVTKAAEFDKSMRNVNSLMQLSPQGFKKMEDQVISLSKTLPQSADVLAQGLYDITSSGFSGADAMLVLKSSAEAASAGLTTTANSAQAITAVLNAYGLKAQDAADVSDTLFQTVNLGVINFEQLSSVIGDVVGIASAASVSIDQVGSAIATMTLTGISGAESGTSLGRMLQSLIQPSTALTKLYKEMGYESGSAALKQKGLHAVIGDIRDATGGSIVKLLELFPEIRAARGALALMANEGKNYDKVALAIEDKTRRAGATMRALHEQMKGVSLQFQMGKNAIDAYAISMGIKLLPYLIDVEKWAMKAGKALGKDMASLMNALAPLVQHLGNVFGDLWTILQNLGEAVAPFASAIASLAIGGIIITLNGLAAALDAIIGPLADSKEATAALGVVLAFVAATKVVALGNAIRFNLVMALAIMRAQLALTAAATAEAGGAFALLRTGVGNFVRSTAAVTTAWILVLAALASAKHGYDEGKKSVKEFNAEFANFGKSSTVGEAMKANDAIQKISKTSQDFVDHWDKRSLLSRLFTPGDNLKAAELGKNLEEMGSKAQKSSFQIGAITNGLVDFDQSISGLKGQAKLDYYNDNLQTMAQRTALAATQADMLTAAGVRQGDSYDTVIAKLTAYHDNVQSGAEASQNLVKAMTDIAANTKTAEERVKDLTSALDSLVGVFLSADQANIAFEASLDDLTKKLIDNKAGALGAKKAFDENTAAGRDNKTAVIGAVGALTKKIEADAKAGASAASLSRALSVGRDRLVASGMAAGFSRDQMSALIRQYHLTPELVKTVVKALGADATSSQLRDLAAQADRLNKTVTITVQTVQVGGGLGYGVKGNSAVGRSPIAQADGGVVNYYADGDHVAQIAPAGSMRVWAEPETGGEAYIPLASAKRNRSLKVLSSVADSFGFDLVEASTETDAAVQFFAGGGHHETTKQRQARMAREAKARTAAAAKTRAAATRQRQAAIAARAAAVDAAQVARANALQLGREYRDSNTDQTGPNFDPLGAISDYTSDRDRRDHARATYLADASKNPHDTADDFYRKSAVTLPQLDVMLNKQIDGVKTWRGDLAKIASGAGADVARALQQMGDKGVALTRQMATATKAEMQKLADDMRSLKFQDYTTDKVSELLAKQAFASNLATLVQTGHADLASSLASQGYESAGELARQAASGKVSATDLNALGSNATAQDALDSSKLPNALHLAALLQASGGKLGIIGLSRASSMSISDVVGLLQSFNSQVFSSLGGSMRQIRTDQELLNRGRQPSGMAQGGIVQGGGKSGMYYQWAEPGQGGESLIPLGQDKRPRAMAIWQETGRLLGARQSGSGSVISIKDGAVRVNVVVPGGSNLTSRDVEAATRRAVDGALNGLLAQVQSGKR